jgi:hypothetical protein
MIRYSLLGLVLLLSACGTTPPKPDDTVVNPVVPQKQTVTLQQSLLAPCPPIPPFVPDKTNGSASQGYTVQWTSEALLAWQACTQTKDSLVQTIRKAFNINTTTLPSTSN